MDPSGIALLVISCVISFGVGRTIMHFRNKRRNQKAAEAHARMLRERPPEPVALNKAKRKRQLQDEQKAARASRD
jgi:hypothetical protein